MYLSVYNNIDLSSNLTSSFARDASLGVGANIFRCLLLPGAADNCSASDKEAAK